MDKSKISKLAKTMPKKKKLLKDAIAKDWNLRPFDKPRTVNRECPHCHGRGTIEVEAKCNCGGDKREAKYYEEERKKDEDWNMLNPITNLPSKDRYGNYGRTKSYSIREFHTFGCPFYKIHPTARF